MTELSLFRLRVGYRKAGRLRYLGHLEVAHTLDRAVRRAGLPYAVTQGFSPHMRLGLCAALPVGTASEAEWFDLILTSYIPAQQALDRLVRALPRDLAPARAGYLDMRAPALTAFITRSVYDVTLTLRAGATLDSAAAEHALKRVCVQGSIVYLRGRKEKRLDLERTLAGFTVTAPRQGTLSLELDARQDNDGALRPELLVAALDRELAQTDRALGIGAQSYDCFQRVEIVRTAQTGLSADGAVLDPIHDGNAPC